MTDGDTDLRYVRDTLGHASISTTSIYLHAEDGDRHRSIEAGYHLGWGCSHPMAVDYSNALALACIT